MASRGVGLVLFLASLMVLAASGNLSGIPILLSLAALTALVVVQASKSKETSSLREAAGKR